MPAPSPHHHASVRQPTLPRRCRHKKKPSDPTPTQTDPPYRAPNHRLIIGFLDVPLAFAPRLPYDVALGLLGIALTFSAAEDFKGAHAKVKNIASGALDREATVSHSEMVEHGFYQILNLCMVRKG